MSRRSIAPRYHRRGRLLDALSVALLLALMAALGCIVMLASAPHAKADSPSPYVIDYAIENGDVACSVLDEYPSVGGLIGLMQGIAEHGNMTPYEAGQVAGLAVYEYCPRYIPLLDRFTGMYAHSGGAVA